MQLRAKSKNMKCCIHRNEDSILKSYENVGCTKREMKTFSVFETLSTDLNSSKPVLKHFRKLELSAVAKLS